MLRLSRAGLRHRTGRVSCSDGWPLLSAPLIDGLSASLMLRVELVWASIENLL